LETNKIRLLLDGRWALDELAATSKGYNQLYSFAYSLLPNLPTTRLSEVAHVYANLPWRGGFSTVNFFFNIFAKIPPTLRPQIVQIKYASPGFIELAELVAVAGLVARFVKTVCGALNFANDTYRRIQKGAVEHGLNKTKANKEELDLLERQIKFCKSSCKDLVSILGMTEEEERTLDIRVNGNDLMKLKLLMSVYRRAEPLAILQSSKKLKVTDESVE
jgi:hypothetical protein